MTDPTPLQERIAEELYYDQHPEGRHRSERPAAVYPDDAYEYRDLAAAVLPIIAAEVRKAQADAWDEGHTEGRADEMHGGFPNPYRETGDSDEQR